MTFKIEKNVPVPTGGGRGAHRKYPFKEMEVGDSFFVPLSSASYDAVRSSASWALARYQLKLSVRAATEDGAKGVRVWRLADEPKLRAVK